MLLLLLQSFVPDATSAFYDADTVYNSAVLTYNGRRLVTLGHGRVANELRFIQREVPRGRAERPRPEGE